jgi:hypothetical protein
MAKRRNNSRANPHQKNSLAHSNSNNDILDDGLKSVETLVAEQTDKGKVGGLGILLNDALKSNNAATSEQKQNVADNLEENISRLVGELKKLIKVSLSNLHEVNF